MSHANSKLAFFRQSGWMLIATFAGGMFMWAVHSVIAKPVDQVNLGALTQFLSKHVYDPLTKGEYGLFAALIQIVNLMGIPAIGLQTVFAHQAAGAVTEAQERQLRGTIRAVMGILFILWLAVMVLVFALRGQLMADLKINEPAALWFTFMSGLPIVFLPVLAGVLQGRQNFLWLGWQSFVGGAGRFLAVAVIVRLMGGRTAGVMAGVMLGSFAALAVCAWQSWSVMRGPADPFDWRRWLERVIPLTVGLGASTFMLSADMLVVRSLFPEGPTGLYGAAGTIGRALVFFTVPMAAVMFPKIVHAAARSEKTDVLALALGATLTLGAGAAIALTIFPKLPFLLLMDRTYLPITPLLPWFAWCMLPLPLATVLINNLLARQRFEAVPWLLTVALAYGLTLLGCGGRLLDMPQLDAFKMVVQILGAYGLLLLGVAGWFTWHQPKAAAKARQEAV